MIGSEEDHGHIGDDNRRNSTNYLDPLKVELNDKNFTAICNMSHRFRY